MSITLDHQSTRSTGRNSVTFADDDDWFLEQLNSNDELEDSEDDEESFHSDESSSDESSSYLVVVGKAPEFLRQIVIMLFVYLAVSAPIFVYGSTRAAQVNAFESDYNALASTVIDAFGLKIVRMLGAIDSLSIAATSYALDLNKTWPFVTLLDFDLSGINLLHLSETVYVGFHPIVDKSLRARWENYTEDNIDWLYSHHYSQLQDQTMQSSRQHLLMPESFSKQIYRYDNKSRTRAVMTEEEEGPFLPSWQAVPANPAAVNLDILSIESDNRAINAMMESQKVILSELRSLDDYGTAINAEILSTFQSKLIQADTNFTEMTDHTTATVYYPVFDTFESDKSIVAVISTFVLWQRFFMGILPPNAYGIICVLENECGDTLTLELDGKGVRYAGKGDLHDQDYDYLEHSFFFSELHNTTRLRFSNTLANFHETYCPYSLHVYPSDQLHQQHITSTALIYAAVVAAAFVFISILSMTYDCVVERRRRHIIRSAKDSRAVVSSLFPEEFRNRMLEKNNGKDVTEDTGIVSHPKLRIKNFLHQKKPTEATSDFIEKPTSTLLPTKSVADLFPHCTVLFADISGFSAWSSERQPEQIFILLETIFQAFDKLARRRSVFKVETIGDCYVAVTGLPDPQSDHAVRMAKFAREGLSKARELTRILEKELGPDTGDLKMRIGIHSGQVTAGIMGGKKCRFQLFGDTVNTASRMESTGERNRIQISQETAQLLIDAGKDHWIQPREDMVNAKGKGFMRTFWLIHRSLLSLSSNADLCSLRSSQISSRRSSIASRFSLGSYSSDDEHSQTGRSVPSEADKKKNEIGDHKFFHFPVSLCDAKKDRLIDWLVDILLLKLKQVITERGKSNTSYMLVDPNKPCKGDTVLDEVVEEFIMPKFSTKSRKDQVDPESIQVNPVVVSQLRKYVAAISERYNSNPFHNFEHASHVTMTSEKFLKRIISPENVDYHRNSLHDIAEDMHNCTFGITSDALAQFAVTFAALIHDVDHMGVPNNQLSKEKPELHAKYKYQGGLAEQNSVDIAWELLMDYRYKDLLECICSNEQELTRFRHYVVNLVMATDIFNKQLETSRNKRWDKAFNNVQDNSSLSSGITSVGSNGEYGANLKATIALEHIIQAADVSHTMQHWNIYKKWNERLFQEMCSAYESGRAEKDPSEGWYMGELWFYDNYIIPLAQKLKECGVFGVSSDECLDYAIRNRKEWALKGQTLVTEMKERYEKRKMLSFTHEEIEHLSSADLERVLQILIKNGRAFGTTQDKQENTAEIWLNALEIYEKSPAASSLNDRSIIFPVLTGLMTYVRGGMILQDKENTFEQEISRKFFREAQQHNESIHFACAVAVRCEVLARAGRFKEALSTFDIISDIYDPTKHSIQACAIYGTDLAAQAYALRAVWYHQLGDATKSIECCLYTLQQVLPFMDLSNVQNTFDIIFPILYIMKPRGSEGYLRDMFDKMVVNRNQNTDFILCSPVFKPLLFLLDICHDERKDYNEGNDDEVVEWLLSGENGLINGFIDNLYSSVCWSPNSITAELCLRIVKKLDHRRDNNSNNEISANDEKILMKKIVRKGLIAARLADQHMKDDNGNVIMVCAYEVHKPIIKELVEFDAKL